MPSRQRLLVIALWFWVVGTAAAYVLVFRDSLDAIRGAVGW
jgi:hypothetical protein